MSDLSFPARVSITLRTLEELQADPMTNKSAYSPQDIRNIIKLWSEA